MILICFVSFQTFCVVSKRFRKNYIHRFTATSSFFFFSPFSSVRKACIYLCTNQFFDYLVMATILLNCVFLAMAETIEEAEWVSMFDLFAQLSVIVVISSSSLEKGCNNQLSALFAHLWNSRRVLRPCPEFKWTNPIPLHLSFLFHKLRHARPFRQNSASAHVNIMKKSLNISIRLVR